MSAADLQLLADRDGIVFVEEVKAAAPGVWWVYLSFPRDSRFSGQSYGKNVCFSIGWPTVGLTLEQMFANLVGQGPEGPQLDWVVEQIRIQLRELLRDKFDEYQQAASIPPARAPEPQPQIKYRTVMAGSGGCLMLTASSLTALIGSVAWLLA
ncbi:hypothetical protein [Kitasatospora sp. NPDC127060]|uniref:hypothetical protein n=1 Tax=Kitasatospora sp. NPDC127060 TaxID=3347121 RepID=UPI00365AB829